MQDPERARYEGPPSSRPVFDNGPQQNPQTAPATAPTRSLPDRNPALIRAVKNPQRDAEQIREQALQRSPAQFLELYARVGEHERAVMLAVLRERTSSGQKAIRVHLGDALHPDDLPLWKQTHPDKAPDAELTDGQGLTVAGIELSVLHTPGHASGAVCLYAPALTALFGGDTLFAGGPGATGRSYSHFPTIIESIRDRLLTLPGDTVVRSGNGGETTVAAGAPYLQEWIGRGF